MSDIKASFRKGLAAEGSDTYLTISSAILSGNFPTLVPPNFWTTQEWSGELLNSVRDISGLVANWGCGGLIDSARRRVWSKRAAEV